MIEIINSKNKEEKGKRILVDILHPAYFHRLKYIIKELQEKGYEIVITARNKDVTFSLLNEAGLKYYNLGKPGRGKIGLGIEYIKRTYTIYKIAKKTKPELMINEGTSIGIVGKILGIPTTSICNAEDLGIVSIIMFKTVDKICTPLSFKKNLGKKQIRFQSFPELGYLHKRFKPNSQVLKKLNVKEGEKFFILRFVAWQSSHDFNEKGLALDWKKKIIDYLSTRGKVFISSEGKLPTEFEKYKLNTSSSDIHSVLYYATLLVTDGQSMAIEAAMLGTPSIRTNSLVGTLHGGGEFEELEKEYKLIFSIKNNAKAFEKIEELLKNDNLKKEWQEKRERLLREKVDLTDWFVNFVMEKRYLKKE